MATPKRKTSHARTARRKAHWLGALNAPSVTTCPHCGDMTLSYSACPSCGFYKSRQAVKIKSEA
ncbi:MAG: 50S ribosomal protein L32 [Synergistaceae bacterium]|jgi:large subunit ribosomal protein L32|nr:50S ribosomal protein L32 [Synergistaceae bacterium]